MPFVRRKSALSDDFYEHEYLPSYFLTSVVSEKEKHVEYI